MDQITALFEDAWRRVWLGPLHNYFCWACLWMSWCACIYNNCAQVWSFGIRQKDKRVSKKAFVHGYTHIIKRQKPRQQLSATLEDLLGGCFDIFDDTLHGERTEQMTKDDFVKYQVRALSAKKTAAGCLEILDADFTHSHVYMLAPVLWTPVASNGLHPTCVAQSQYRSLRGLNADVLEHLSRGS